MTGAVETALCNETVATLITDYAYSLTVSVYITILLLISIVFELLTKGLDRLFKNKDLMHIIRAVYEEIMVIGVVSFVLFLGHATGVFHALTGVLGEIECPDSEALVFEWIHFLLFLFTLMYICSAVYLIFAEWFLSRNWSKFDQMGYEFMIQNASHTHYQKKEMSFFRKFFCYFSIWSEKRELDYTLIREATIKRHRLPDTFAYSIYLKLFSREFTIKLIDIHFSVYALVLVLVWLNFIRTKLLAGKSDHPSSFGSFLLFFVGGLALTISIIVVWLIISRIEKKVIAIESDFLHTHSSTEENLNLQDPIYVYQRKRITKHKRRAEKYSSSIVHLFPFRSPGLIINAVQFLTLATTSYLGICVWYYINFFSFGPLIIDLVLICVNVVLLPLVLWDLVKIMGSGELADKHLLLKALDKQMRPVATRGKTLEYYMETSGLYKDVLLESSDDEL